ncbi:CopD family protein [Mycolicibacterium sp. P9-64]|uniref:CopD family protein n=1 Tax=Mycolicibacterium sp. P9-64 TaxID=2024612 RepID=UPI001F5BB483|nr:CopD family protein [Mycolicibacterium sp. P9-64]
MTRLRIVAAGVAVIVASAVAAWALASPQNSLSATLIRAVADCSAVVTLGLAVVPMFDADRYRREVAERAAGPLIVASAVWAVAEIVRIVIDAAQAAGTSPVRVGVRTTVDFAVDTAAGRSGLMCAVAAVVVGVAAVVATRGQWRPAIGVVMAGGAAVGMTGRSLVGHLAESPAGGLAVTVHALAAAVWCGALAALVLVVEHRGQWARVLPRFSQVSLVCVVTLVVCGVAATALRLHSPAEFVTTGYGRLLLAKIALTGALTVLAWRNRSWWLPAARSHRASADVSRLRSRIELAGMAVALTLAAALAVTG